MSARAPRVPIESQIAAVSSSASIARAAVAHRNEKDAVMLTRAAALDAAVKTLEWVRDNAEALRRVARNGAVGERRRFSDLPLATQSAMRCGDPRFQRFLKVEDAYSAAIAVRRACNVESRKELDAVAEAGSVWRKIDAEFEAWLRGMDGGEDPA